MVDQTLQQKITQVTGGREKDKEDVINNDVMTM